MRPGGRQTRRAFDARDLALCLLPPGRGRSAAGCEYAKLVTVSSADRPSAPRRPRPRAGYSPQNPDTATTPRILGQQESGGGPIPPSNPQTRGGGRLKSPFRRVAESRDGSSGRRSLDVGSTKQPPSSTTSGADRPGTDVAPRLTARERFEAAVPARPDPRPRPAQMAAEPMPTRPRPKRTAGPSRANRMAPKSTPKLPKEPKRSKRWTIGGLSVSVRMLGIVVVAGMLALNLVPVGMQWYQQNQEYRAVTAELAATEATNQALRDSLDAWDNDNYVANQAKRRLGFVWPGEVQYNVVGLPETAQSSDDIDEPKGQARPWPSVLMQSMIDADTPPASDSLSGMLADEESREPADGDKNQ